MERESVVDPVDAERRELARHRVLVEDRLRRRWEPRWAAGRGLEWQALVDQAWEHRRTR
jgi:hypothetical protein